MFEKTTWANADGLDITAPRAFYDRPAAFGRSFAAEEPPASPLPVRAGISDRAAASR